jgi:hypothetical protein
MVKMVPCSHCIGRQDPDPQMFKFEDCMKTQAQGKPWVTCTKHVGNPQQIRVDHLAPDISFNEIPIIDASKLSIQTKIGTGTNHFF